MMEKYLRPGIAELVGTFFLTFIGGGAICVNAMLQSYGETGSGLLGVAIAHGLALSIGVTATMALSGGHLNPAVTITMWVYKKLDTDMTVAYIACQLLGAVIAGGLLVLFFQQQTAVARDAHFGAPHLNTKILHITEETNMLQIQAWGAAIEAALTFLLVFAVFGTAVDPRAPKVAGFGIGLTVAADILMGGPLTGAAMNPARAFGPALWEAGIMGFDALRDHLVYWVGPIIGGILAGGLYLNVFLPQETAGPTKS
jgi:MIP family channel proteins